MSCTVSNKVKLGFWSSCMGALSVFNILIRNMTYQKRGNSSIIIHIQRKELFEYKGALLQRSDMFFLFVTLMVSFCLSKNYVKRGQTDASDAHSLFIQLKTMSTNKSGSPQDNSPNLGIDFMTQ